MFKTYFKGACGGPSARVTGARGRERHGFQHSRQRREHVPGRPAHDHEAAPAAYLSTLPLRGILSAWREADIPGVISNSAGLYLCNLVMYQALHYLHETNAAHRPCGFLHVPANPAVALAVPEDRPAMPYLPQSEITRAVRIAAERTGDALKNIEK